MTATLKELDEVLKSYDNDDYFGALACASFLGAHAREIRAAWELKARVTWQPIETAPKDGTRILATIRWEYSDGTAGEAQDVIYWYEGGMFWVVPTPMNYVQGLDDDVKPTHWMPLPAPPAQESNEDEDDDSDREPCTGCLSRSCNGECMEGL